MAAWNRGGGASLLLMVVLVIVSTVTSQQQTEQTEQPPTTTASTERFSCVGRVPGYYADPASGCQVYHMCGAGGRKFTYRCPEHTLFQQRMMVCDHWFMVDCRTATSQYSANLLLGDRSRPFVAPGEAAAIRELVAPPQVPKNRSSFDFGRKKSTLPPSSKRKEQTQPSTVRTLVPTFSRESRRNNSLASVVERFTFPSTLFKPSTLSPPLSPLAINTQITSLAPPSPTPEGFSLPKRHPVTVPGLLARAQQLISQTTARPEVEVPSVTILPPSEDPPITVPTVPRETPSTLAPVSRSVTILPTSLQPPGVLDPEITNSGLNQGGFDALAINSMSRPPLGLSATTLAQVRASLNVSTTPQSLDTTLQEEITEQEEEELLAPATINSLLREPAGEPALLQIIPDTRRMFFIPSARGFDPDLEFDLEDGLQRLELAPLQPRPRGPMRFHEQREARSGAGCPAKCFPAFLRPGTCEPCVILR